MNLPFIAALLIVIAVLLIFVGILRSGRREETVESRMELYGLTDELAQGIAQSGDEKVRWSGMNRLLTGFGVRPRLAGELNRAGLPLTAAEFALVVLGAGVLGFLVGTLRLSPGLGLPLGVATAALPIGYLKHAQGKRQRMFTEQLPDVLTLLVGALRAGHGLTQSLDIVADRLRPPASTEFRRAMRNVGLGLSVEQTLGEMANRVGSDDLDLVVTAITVQLETGGNLAETLETIGETVRERLRILREVRVMTAQQRITGYLLAFLPVGMAIVLFLLRPEYMMHLFEPGLVRLLPIAAGVLMLMGFLVIRKILDIEV